MSKAGPTSGTPLAPIEARVAWLEAPRRLAFRSETLDASRLGAGDILCRTITSVISPGTELAAYTGLPPLHGGAPYPRVQGYCNVARVLSAGPAAAGVAVGDRVLTFGSHRSHFIVDAGAVLATLPAAAVAEHAACAYLYHLGYNAVLRSGVRAGSKVLVIGLGALGLTSVAMAALAGADVFALSDQPHAQGLAVRFGARGVFPRARTADLREAMGPGLADVVIATTNGWPDWAIALEQATTRGTVAVLGFPGRGEAPGTFNPLESRSFYAKQLRVEAVGHSPERPDGRGFARFNERDNLRFLVEQIVCGRLEPAALVSGRYPAEELAQAYEDLLARRQGSITFALQWTPE